MNQKALGVSDIPLHFYIVAFFIGVVMGGIQALSRSTFAKMIPDSGNHEGYFSFYNVCKKKAIMYGLIMWGYQDDLTGSMHHSIIALGAWFIIGLILLFIVMKTKKPPPPIAARYHYC